MKNRKNAATAPAAAARAALTRRTVIAGLLGTLGAFVDPLAAHGQVCSQNENDAIICELPAGNASAVASNTGGGGSGADALPLSATLFGSISYAAPSSTNAAVQVSSYGVSGATGGIAKGMTLQSIGNLTISQGQPSINDYVFGIWAQQLAGSSNANTGGSTLDITQIDNQGAINLNLAGVSTLGGAGILGIDQGGTGAPGFTGGSSAGISIVNGNSVSATLSGSQGFGGIAALSNGGAGASGGTAGGGAGGTAFISSSAAVSVNYTWQNVSNVNHGVWGILAQSEGGAGSTGSFNGGVGGGAGQASVTLNLGGDVAVSVQGTPPSSTSSSSNPAIVPSAPDAAVAAASVGGTGGNATQGNSNSGGNGGGAAQAAISLTDANVSATGDNLPGLLAYSVGGAGGYGGALGSSSENPQNPSENGGAAGSAGGVSLSATAQTQSITISTASSGVGLSAAIAAVSQGGAGGYGGYSQDSAFSTSHGGNGGTAGDAGAVGVLVQGTNGKSVTLSTNGATSPGIYAASLGGAGGVGGGADTAAFGTGDGGNGGAGGAGGDVNVSMASTVINTGQTGSPGIVARSEGGIGAAGGGGSSGTGTANGGNGGNGGNSGNVTVQTDNASSITTQGTESMGILAQSLSAAGGDANGNNAIGGGNAGNAGIGGNTGNVAVINGASITTAGASARGILVQSMAGSGGVGGPSWSIANSGGGTGGNGGGAGAVDVTNSGAISTGANNAEGILLQSIGGGGGAGGQASGVIANLGGSGGTATSGGALTFTNSGAISTVGQGSTGVLGQSIGGSGGDGGGASGITVTVGGTGGSAAAGGAITANLNSGGNITTTGVGAHGAVFQSIGGGGGSGGDAVSTGTFVSVGVGGTGGDGGAGGTVIVNTNGANISAAGNKATGLIAQSIGGGGGTGGSAMATSIGAIFDASVSVGGQGGNAASDAGPVSVTVAGGAIATGQDPHLLLGSTASGSCAGPASPSGSCNVLPVDSHGVLVQSIGGGGGHGGQATAQAIAVGAPVSTSGSQLSISAAVAVGGKGGAGGDGGTAQFALASGGTITTSGNGSIGALVQSVGGGGGDGGDSSAMAASIGYGSGAVPEGSKAPAVQLASTVAGDGGQPGNGGTVQVAVGGTLSADGTVTCDCNGTNTYIQTFGDYAPGIVAQSIGGGGGNAGMGGGNTQDFGTGSSTSLSFNVGRQGSPGGAGGNVTVNLDAGAGIQTWGSAAVGIIAQSIGGGGGTAEGGAFSLGQSLTQSTGPTQKSGASVNLGNQQSDKGGAGGTVNVSVYAPITTHGNDATGVLAQSIGGGGGLGGSAGSDGSGDNPVVAALDGREFESNVVSYLDTKNWTPEQVTSMNVSIGGTGGAGGSAQAVSVTLGAQISTLGNAVVAGGNQQASSGDWAHAIVAQSIGGGGGKGGTAVATGAGEDPAEYNVNTDVAVGGTGGNGGNAGSVNVTFASGAGIQTVGYGATAIVAQSIGGGGGLGADGSDAAGGNLSAGVAVGSSGGSAGAGSTVDFENQAYGGGATINTAGMFADGMNLQSIGGGGGIAGSGASIWGAQGTLHVSSTMTLNAGGGTASSGAGGNVYVNQDYTNNVGLNINTQGYGAYGIVAQSIGGGGGNVIANQAGSGSPTLKIGGLSNDAGATGGPVLVQLTGDSTINANGTAGIGVVAQSVGSGGGIIRINDGSNATPSMTTGYNPAFVNQGSPGPANGGSVQVTSYATINANGPGGIGIFAQSVGGGGGLILDGGTLYAGAPLQQQRNCTTNSCGGISATGSNLVVSALGPVSATGPNGIGIFAQAAGYGPTANSTPTIWIGTGNLGQPATITGGSGNGAAVWIDRPAGNSGYNTSLVTVQKGGTLTTSVGSGGTAVTVTGGGSVTLYTLGTVIGNVSLDTADEVAGPQGWDPGTQVASGILQSDRGSFLNAGTWVPGAQARGNILNQGTIAFDNPAMTTRMNGHFIQTASGTLSPMIDSLNGKASLFQVDGSASVDGVIAPNAITLLPGTVPVFTAGSLDTTAQAKDSLIFDWDARRSNNTITLTPAHADFTPGGVGLNGSQSSLANYYSRAWNNADPTIAGVFGGLSHIDDGGQYKDTLNSFSSKATQAQSIALANSAGTILGSSMSCPVFEGQGVMLDEDNCAWGQVNGRWSDQSTSGDTQGYHVSGTTYRVGGQHRIAPNWYLGASAAAGQSWASAKGGTNGDGDTYDGSITLKRVDGPWYFAGSLAMASGSFDSNRHVNAFGATQTLTSKPSIFLAGTRLRAGYEFAHEDWYVRPYGDLDFIYTHMPGFKENGAPGYALKVRSNNQFNVALSPMVELGHRFDVDAKTTLRAYAAVGFSYRPDSTYTLSSSFVGADSSDGTFTDYVKSPEVLGKVDMGVQLFRAGDFEMKAAYTLDFSNSFTSQSASARFAYHF